MKKTTSALLALVLVVSLAAPTFAFSAQLSAQNLAVDGQPIACEKYNIDGSNYFKLRDLAKLLDGTGSQFDVGWDGVRGVVSITTNHAYTTPNGTELVVGDDQSATTQVSAQTIMIDGVVRTDLTVYNIGGSNYFKLREMGDALGFDVGYVEATNTATVASRGQLAIPTPKTGMAYEITDVINIIEDSSYGSGKRFRVIVEVTNTGDTPIYLSDCVLDYEDNNGHLLHTYDFLSVVPDIVQPNEKGYFYTNGSSAFDDDVSFENGCNLVPKVTITKAKGELKRHEVSDTSLYNSYGTVGCKGRITNETDEEISNIYVQVVYYDKDGRVLGISGTNVSNIKATDRTSFDLSGILMNEFSVEDVADYVVYADEYYYQYK